MQACRRCCVFGEGWRAEGGGTLDAVARRRAQYELQRGDDRLDVVGPEPRVSEKLHQLNLRPLVVRGDQRHDRLHEHLEPYRRNLRENEYLGQELRKGRATADEPQDDGERVWKLRGGDRTQSGTSSPPQKLKRIGASPRGFSWERLVGA